MQSIRTLKVMVTASKTLPKVLSNSQEENSWAGSSLVIIIAAFSSAMVLLIVVVIIIVVRCKRENKAVRTYECKGKQSDTNRHDQFCEIKGTNHRKNLSVDSNQVIWKPALNVRRPSTNYDSNSEVTSLSHNMASTAQHYAAPTVSGPTPCVAPYHTEKNLVPTSTASHSSAQSHHDVDSGRGDSDQDLGVSDVTFDRGYVPARNEIQQTNVSASRCNEQCLLYGHSDACWMPMVEQEPEFKQRSIYPTTSSPYEKHTASQQYMSSCLEPIPEKSQIQSDWSQMDSDSNLSSIYSNVQPSHRRDDYIKIAGGRNISPSFRIDLTNSITQGYKTELL
uniref:Protocadherin domain-containing protein n=1 Tax=Ciona savignyi TaxID=51511 RepID=H2YEY9_CIOSA